ncbi:hypothetical protein HanHA300_Chr09g0305771 [Helianthus annuus]|nr:hypothetical protein HanHA300_Chr09g0305771 [Helianthus annuus]KAJ0710391.1 hypothetical protein HanOQP8_Chr09g0311831 [Helianthus annuus]
MYSTADAFVAPPTTNEGAHVLNSWPRRAITPAGVEVIVLSSWESIASSEPRLNPLSYAFVGSLCDLGVDPDVQKPKRPSKKKKVTVVEGAKPVKVEASVVASDAASRKDMARPQGSTLDNFVIVADSIEELRSIGGKFKASEAAGVRSSGSASSKDQVSGATPTSTPVEEEMKLHPIPELTKKNSSKRRRKESETDPAPGAKKIVSRKPVIRKKVNLGSLMSQISPGMHLITLYQHFFVFL